jgi:hypothetical protein
VTADIDPSAGREAGDALGGTVSDFRARLFVERTPEAYAVLQDPNPPALAKLKEVEVVLPPEAADLMKEGLTTGADAFYEAVERLEAGEVDTARKTFEALSARFGTIWIGRASRERLSEIAALEAGKGGA